MSLIANQLLIDNLGIPKEISMLVKDYVFHRINKIPKTDSRYEMLLQIPKLTHKTNNFTFVLLRTLSTGCYLLYYAILDNRTEIGIKYVDIRIRARARVIVYTLLGVHFYYPHKSTWTETKSTWTETRMINPF
jgi:hypothetical protein